uniref:NR LBD domain-containing protein n=1 Tax=Caenorhabditis tropicalis TaxID=1561998 RepID=A0A1I7UD16_9PELO
MELTPRVSCELSKLATVYEAHQRILTVSSQSEEEVVGEVEQSLQELNVSHCHKKFELENVILKSWVLEFRRIDEIAAPDRTRLMLQYRRAKWILDHLFETSRNEKECSKKRLVFYGKYFFDPQMPPLLIDSNPRSVDALEE